MVRAKPAGKQPEPELQVRNGRTPHNSHGGVHFRRRDEGPVVAQQRTVARQVIWRAKAATCAEYEGIERAGQVMMRADPPPPRTALAPIAQRSDSPRTGDAGYRG